MSVMSTPENTENTEIKENPIAVPELEEDLTNLPDTIICTAEIDPLASDGIKFVKKLKKNEIEEININKYFKKKL